MNLKGKIKDLTNYIVLILSIIILFVLLHLIGVSSNMYIDLFGNRIKATENILIKENDEYYLSYKYVKENIDNEIYFDNISKKIVISSDNGLYKAKLDSKNINVNFEDIDINNIGVIQSEEKYISLEVLKTAYNMEWTVCNKTIYGYNNNYYEGKVKNNAVGVYKEDNFKSNIVDYVNKNDKIKIISEKGNFALVKVNDKEVGYILKRLLKYTIPEIKKEKQENKENVYMFADVNSRNVQKDLPIDGIMLDMFEVTQTSTNINENNFYNSFITSCKNNGYKLYGIIGNGYELASFNTSTTSQILADESKRINLINNITNKIEEYSLDGIALDFRKLQEKDIHNYIQFIKELKAFSKKEVIVNIDASEYEQYSQVINYTDFSIINVYGQRDAKASRAGSISEIKWMKEIIENCIENAKKEKIVVGIPAYTILWTEKNSNVIDSDIYNLKAISEYVKENELKPKEVNGQNYVELKKGSLVYRMWLEDELSISNRLNIIKDNKVEGIAIYKLGYENETLINILKNNY